MKKVYLASILIIIAGVIFNTYIYLSKQNVKNPIVKVPLNNIPNVQVQSDNRPVLIRPIAYMINNITEALPQSGIYGADYVYEMLVEGGLTRLMAVYTKGGIDKIGPIRSARHNFLDLSMEYDAVFAHFGGSPKAFEDIQSLGINNLNGISLDGKMYWRDKTRKAPHNAYTNIENTLKYMKLYKYDRPVTVNHFIFNQNDTPISGNSALKIFIPYSYAQNVRYEYDENNKNYKRFMNNKPHIDEFNDSNQLTAKNIIIEFAKNTTMDSEDRQNIFLVGAGTGYFITDGKFIPITWKKPSRQDKTVFYDETGKEILLNKGGQTWIQIVPIESKVIIQ